jgi:hypothetical protein
MPSPFAFEALPAGGGKADRESDDDRTQPAPRRQVGATGA